VYKLPFLRQNYQEIANAIYAGGVAILPTDTIPGFSADPTCQSAIGKIFHIKNRSPGNPLLLLVPDYLAAEKLCVFPAGSQSLINSFWPGPLTLLLTRKKGVLPGYFPHVRELALRIPGNPEVRKFLHVLGTPLASTSVNISGSPPLTHPEEIESTFSNEDIVLSLDESVKIPTGLSPSTIVRLGPGEVQVVREGGIGKDEVMRVFENTL